MFSGNFGYSILGIWRVSWALEYACSNPYFIYVGEHFRRSCGSMFAFPYSYIIFIKISILRFQSLIFFIFLKHVHYVSAGTVISLAILAQGYSSVLVACFSIVCSHADRAVDTCAAWGVFVGPEHVDAQALIFQGGSRYTLQTTLQ